METLVYLLILFPLVPALACLFLPEGMWRGLVIKGSALALGVGAILLAFQYTGSEPVLIDLHLHLIDEILFWAGLAVAGYLLYRCRSIRKAEAYIPVLIVVQAAIIGWCEKSGQMPKVEAGLYIDHLSVIMALIIGIVGGVIAIYAVSYMRDYHSHHGDVPEGRKGFFFTVFLFLGAMFGIVFSNNLSWLYFCWEITTLCSFLMIGYSKSEEATRNAFLALGLNLLGGLGFTIAIFLFTTADGAMHTLALNEIISSGSGVVLIPVVLICIAGLAKSAQMPFSSWLLGAMVAPTPVSALLHSSTMVKAGVFILIKFAPVLTGTAAGYFIALLGGVTFLTTSLVAITQSNAKRVLAYSTIANLGLIVMCAAIGTKETVWAAILLTIFHAVAKALLFLGTGTVEHQIGSRDIEDMEGLIARKPLLTVMMLVGILGMFLAPFGMLISKYATLKALLEVEGFPGGGIFLAIILAFGSAPTLFFWAKWMGKMVGMPRTEVSPEGHIPGGEWFALGLLAVFTFFACVFFAPIAGTVIDPYVQNLYGSTASLATDTLVIMMIMMGVLFLLPVLYLVFPREQIYAPAYLSGANITGSASYRGAMGAERTVQTRNYYLTNFIREKLLNRSAGLVTGALILVTLISLGIS